MKLQLGAEIEDKKLWKNGYGNGNVKEKVENHEIKLNQIGEKKIEKESSQLRKGKYKKINKRTHRCECMDNS